MSAAVVDRLMALARKACMQANIDTIEEYPSQLVQEPLDALRAAIVEALDLGKPLAWISDRDQLQLRMGDKPGAHWRPLHAAPKDAP